MGVVLATHGAAYGIGIGILFHIMLERKFHAQNHPEEGISALEVELGIPHKIETAEEIS